MPIYHLRDKPENIVHDWFKIETLKKTYSYFLEPINGEDMWEIAGGNRLLPPTARKLPGRPKTQRRNELRTKKKKGSERISRVGTTISCTRCKLVRHNKSSCRGLEVKRSHPREISQASQPPRASQTSQPSQPPRASQTSQPSQPRDESQASQPIRTRTKATQISKAS